MQRMMLRAVFCIGENIMEKVKRRWSLKSRLIIAFLMTSIIPVIGMNLFSYYNTSGIVLEHMGELTHENLNQTRSALDVWMESYEDILFQIYTDDDIVSMIDKINRGEDVSVNKNQLKRTLHGLFYTKEYIKCITILTDNGTMICYDMLTGSGTNSWIESIGYSKQELYDEVSKDNRTRVFSTQPEISYGADSYYFFHLGHRIIDYRDVNKKLGIVIVSVDEQLLEGVCSGDEDVKNSYNYIVDSHGKIVSHPNKNLITKRIIKWDENPEKRTEQYRKFVQKREALDEHTISVDSVYDEKFNWDIVNVASRNEVLQRLGNQQKIMMMMLGISLITLVLVIAILIKVLQDPLKIL